MNVGTTLPQFRNEAEAALETARAAEQAGLAGVFVFDHLWPLGQPERPALHSKALLGALAVETTRVMLGTIFDPSCTSGCIAVSFLLLIADPTLAASGSR